MNRPDEADPFDPAAYAEAERYDDVPLPDEPPPDEAGPPPDEPATGQRSKKSVATQLTDLVLDQYRPIKDYDGRVYAVDADRLTLALPLRGDGGVNRRLSREFYHRTATAASAAAISDALSVFEGHAQDLDPAPVHLRVAEHEGTTYIDRGTEDHEVIAVNARGWRLTHDAPVLFRRSGLTAPMFRPVRSGTLDDLAGLLNMSPPVFRLVVGWLLSVFLPGMPHPILFLQGQQGTAKTTAMNTLLGLVDPSTSPAKTAPRDEDSWGPIALHSWAIGLDNVSHLPPWLQDSLCKAVTGDGVVKRAKYSDDDVVVMKFRRIIAMTSIGTGALQGDVAERALICELDPIPPENRRTDRETAARVAAIGPGTLGALLDLLAQVLTVLPSVSLPSKPRMADFAELLAALDEVTGWSTLPDYLEAVDDAAVSVIDGDLFAVAIRDFVTARGAWTGPAGELQKLVTPEKPPKGWPTTPQAVGARLTRLAPSLAKSGVVITKLAQSHGGQRGWSLALVDAVLARACDVCAGPLSELLAPSETTHPMCTPDPE